MKGSNYSINKQCQGNNLIRHNSRDKKAVGAVAVMIWVRCKLVAYHKSLSATLCW